MGDLPFAMKLRDIIQTMIKGEIRRSGLWPVYGITRTIDRDGSRCEVLINGEAEPVWVVMNSIQPISAGQSVRILGQSGDLYIDNVVSGQHYHPSPTP